jgi:hypothetical protein
VLQVEGEGEEGVTAVSSSHEGVAGVAAGHPGVAVVVAVVVVGVRRFVLQPRSVALCRGRVATGGIILFAPPEWWSRSRQAVNLCNALCGASQASTPFRE